MRNKTKSIFLYLLYRTVNHYYEGYLEFSNGKDDDRGWSTGGEYIFWGSLNSRVYFLLCVIFFLFKADITLWENFLLYLIFSLLPIEWFWKKQMPEIRKNFKAWRKRTRRTLIGEKEDGLCRFIMLLY